MKITKEISRVEIVDISKLNSALQNGAVLIDVLKSRNMESSGGFYETAEYIIGY